MYREKLSNLKCIEFRNKKTGILNSLIFPRGESEGRTLKDLEYSKELNRVFSTILGEQQTLDDTVHQKFYKKLEQYEGTW